MRTLALLTVLLVAGPAFGQDEAEKLYRAMEKKIASAKTIEAVFDTEMTGEGKTMKMKGKFYFGEDAKHYLTMEGSADGKDMKLLMITDGKTTYVKAGDGKADPQVDRQPADAKLMAGARLFLARLGVSASWFFARGSSDRKGPPDVDREAPIKSFKLGAKEKVGNRDAQVVELVIGPGAGEESKESIWIDTQTQLPLKRVLSSGPVIRITETYSVFNVDTKIDAKLFEVPK